MKKIEIIPLNNIPKININDDIPSIIIKALKSQKLKLEENDILVVAHKIISISEDCFFNLENIKVSRKAKDLSRKIKKDEKFCQLILDNAKRIIKVSKGVIVTENKLGIITANSGIDQSNIQFKGMALLLPKNPDNSARRISMEIKKQTNLRVPVIISDSIGRPWRLGLNQIAIGSYGVKPIKKYKKDLYKNKLSNTEVPIIDELSSAAGILMQKDDGIPVVLIRGYNYISSTDKASVLLRGKQDDIFR